LARRTHCHFGERAGWRASYGPVVVPAHDTVVADPQCAVPRFVWLTDELVHRNVRWNRRVVGRPALGHPIDTRDRTDPLCAERHFAVRSVERYIEFAVIVRPTAQSTRTAFDLTPDAVSVSDT